MWKKDNTSDVAELIESYMRRKIELYDRLGKSPSFASFELAVANNAGAVFIPPNLYKVFDVDTLHKTWMENMDALTKRKRSANHWQAGLKKWLNGQWRKDDKPFELLLKETKLSEAADYRGFVEEVSKINENITKLVSASALTVHHHHHYYCKCHPTTHQLDLKYDEVYSQQLDTGEMHHHHVHPIGQSIPELVLNTHSYPPQKYDEYEPYPMESKSNMPMQVMHSPMEQDESNHHHHHQPQQNFFQQIEWPPFLQDLPQRFPFDEHHNQNLELPEIGMEYPHQDQHRFNPFQTALNDIQHSFTELFKPNRNF